MNGKIFVVSTKTGEKVQLDINQIGGSSDYLVEIMTGEMEFNWFTNDGKIDVSNGTWNIIKSGEPMRAKNRSAYDIHEAISDAIEMLS